MVRTIRISYFGAVAVLAAMAVMLILPSLARAAPTNDNFANAQTLSGQSASVNGTTAGATREAGEPDHYTSNPADAGWWLGDHSVWYRWTAPETERVTVDTCTANIDSILAVYTGGSLENLSRVADNNNDYCGPGWGSKVTFEATAGTTYQIAVSDAGGATQNTFSLNVKPLVPLANDNFANAEEISGAFASVAGTNIGATTETGEDAGFLGSGSVWYRWTAPETGQWRVDTCASGTADFDTVLSVHTGSAVDSLTEVASDDNACSGAGSNDYGSKLSFNGTAGTTYFIRVASDPSGLAPRQGNFTLNLESLVPPVNDSFANAEEISGAFAWVEGTNIGATTETGEGPSFLGSGSVWYRWTAPETGQWRVDTCFSDFGTVLSVHTGSAVDALSEVASNDGDCQLRFDATIGETYYVRVASWSSLQGSFTLNLEPFVPLVNDNFANAEEISGALTSVEGTNIDATTEIGEPAPNGSSSSVWYRWTAPETGRVDLDTCSSDFDTVLSVHTGGAMNALAQLASNDEGCSSVGPNWHGSKLSFNGTAGTTYYIRVASWSWQQGYFTLDLVLSDGVPPDTSITGGPTGLTADDTPTFSFGGSDNNSASTNLLYSYRVDNGGWSAYSNHTSVTLASLSDGGHTFYVRAKDDAGNEDASPATRSFTVEARSPRVATWSPTGTNVSRLNNIVANFSEPMNPTTITTSNVRVAAGTKTVPLAVTLSADGKRATIDPYPANPSQALLANKKYTVTITTAVRDLHGKALDQDSSRAGNQSKVWSFNTGSV